ncbi:MAG TPA: hypothetical protein DGA22_03525 [Acidobacterium sp.]|nr:hypothetical protein [Acidobacterium sp.]
MAKRLALPWEHSVEYCSDQKPKVGQPLHFQCFAHLAQQLMRSSDSDADRQNQDEKQVAKEKTEIGFHR